MEVHLGAACGALQSPQVELPESPGGPRPHPIHLKDKEPDD
jgi:hypothetical protein